MVRDVLLVLHVSGGSLALVGALVASLVQARKGSHRVHVYAGRTFVVGMGLVVISAIPLAITIGSVFLGLIAVFSAYLTATGWRFAKNRRGTLTPLDWAIPVIMAITSVGMIVFGAATWGDQGVVLLVFGLVGLALAAVHLRRLRAGAIRGRDRISNHLVWMLAAAIAAVTAFLVVNGPFGIFDWFLPTIVISPIIAVWSRRVRAGSRTTLDRTPAPTA